jgi:hypothetical protein
LQFLYLWQTPVSDEQIAALRKAFGKKLLIKR